MAATGLSDDPVMEPLVCSPLSDEDGTDEDVLPPPKRKESIIRSSTSNSDAEDDEQTCATTLGKSCTTPNSSAKKGSTSKCTQLVRYSGTPTRKTLNRLLWENFARTDPKHVECRHCKAFLKTTDASTTPLHAHLRNKHKIKYSEYLAAKHKQDVAKVDNENAIRTAIVDRERTALQKINSKPKLINQNIRDALSQCKVPAKYAQNSQAQLKADMDITIFLVTTNQPFSLVEEPGFKRFVESMDPRIIVKNKSTYTRSKCPQLLENVKQAVEKILQNDLPFCDGIAFTSDTWTSRSNDPFQSLTLHYVSKEFELKKFTVDCKSFRGRHTSEAIAKLCDEMINSIPGINSSAMKYATTDSGANMLKAMSIANEITDNIKCFDHILNTCVTKALEQNSLREVVGQCKNLATLTHRSSLSQQKIQRSCDENEPKITYRKIIQPVCTRWNSLHACMDSILAMKSPLLSIKATDNGTDLANAIPDECGFKKLEQIIKPLDEIRRASEMLSAEDKPTIHLVLCYMVTLSNLQAKYGYLGKESLELCRSFTDHLNSRVPNKGKNEYICLVLTLARATHKDNKGLNETLSSWNPSSADPEDEDDEEVQKRAKAQGWSSWTEWSTCSRSCDGGVAYQLRRCHAPHGCKGDAVRYKICNMQPCPEQQDFRAHQCSAYDDVPYDGALLKWTPHYDYSEPCALTCRGRPQHLLEDMPDSASASESFPPVVGDDEPSVIVQLSNRVQDGTRCRPGSLDMCIQGKCQRVGCDLKIGSTKKIDVCGVCGGDGTSCTQPLYQWEIAPMSLCSVTCGGGYKMAMPTCRNRVTGVDVEESLCNASSRPEPTVVQCNTHLCPPKWVTDEWRPCSKSCGGGIRERVVVCAEESNGAKNKVPDEACRGVRPKSQETCNVQECPKWVTGEWSGCSVSCGSGIQIRSVECMDTSGLFSNQCDHKTKPSTGQQCTTGIGCIGDSSASSGLAAIIAPPPAPSPPLPVQTSLDSNVASQLKEKFSHSERDPTLMTYNDQPFYAQPLRQDRLPKAEKIVSQRVPSEATFIQDTEWSPCSVTCGEGIRRKPFRCKIFLEFSKRVATLNDSLCHSYKPLDEVERCVMEPCSYSHNFEESYLKDGNRQNLDGIKVQAAVPGKTYSWREEGYTSCSASCLGGVEELIINCIRDDTGKIVSPFLCSPETKPEARIRTCNDIPCPPRWNYSEFTPCSKSCGFGIQTREVTCIHEVTRGGENTMIVPNSMCTTKPQPDRQYCNIIDCPVRWEVSEWSKCSKPCGGGIKERRVECKQIMAQEHKVERPASMCPSSKPPDKKPCNTKACAPEDQRPPIAGTNSTFIQHDPKKNKITLKIGGAATVFFGTQIKIKCPVKRFNRTKIRWSKDQTPLIKSKKIKISKKGALRIIDVSFKEAGVYTCHAGLSHADLKLSVKAKPGGVQHHDEDRERHREGVGLNALRDHTYVASQNRSDEKGGRRNRDRNRGKNRQRQPPDIVQNAESSVMEDELLWPFQTFSNSKGHQLLMEHEYSHLDSERAEKDEPVRPFNIYELLKSKDTGDDGGDDPSSYDAERAAALESIEYEWMTTPWSECSQTCGANGSGYRLRSARCMVQMTNTSYTVDNSLCEDAGLVIPETVEKCGNVDCPRWVSTEWSLCLQSKCFAWHTALQKRDVFCKFGNVSSSDRCDDLEKPVTKQECYNEMCKGVWRVEPWSECNAACGGQGIKYRILQCVWYGTKKPAGNACRDQPRPAVMKVCKGPPCISNPSECKDLSKYCRNVKTMGLCRLHRYQQQCCKTCRFNIYN